MARHPVPSPAARQALPPALRGWSAPRPAASSGWRIVPPLVGVLLSLVAYLAQNVWHLYDIADLTAAIRALDPLGIALALVLIGVVEGTVVVCFYLPGTAVAILLLVGLQPSWSEALPLLGSMAAGTLAGYALSIGLGRALAQRLPRLVGPAAFARMRGYVERFGLLTFAVAAAHPNPAALAFSVVGYLGARRTWLYVAVAALAQAGWWAAFAATASTVSRQTVVTGGNFQLFLAALFGVWLVYELLPRARE